MLFFPPAADHDRRQTTWVFGLFPWFNVRPHCAFNSPQLRTKTGHEASTIFWSSRRGGRHRSFLEQGPGESRNILTHVRLVSYVMHRIVPRFKSSTYLCLFCTSWNGILDFKAKLYKYYFSFILVAYKIVCKIIVTEGKITALL